MNNRYSEKVIVNFSSRLHYIFLDKATFVFFTMHSDYRRLKLLTESNNAQIKLYLSNRKYC